MSGETTASELPLMERFARALAQIVYEERPDALDRAVTVAELYQDIVPYRRIRDIAGIEMHADYEHALIRLLAGEGGLARIDPETAAGALMIEAESMDPDLSAYRKYAACDVRLDLAGVSTDGIPLRPVIEPPPAEPLSMRSPPPPPSDSMPETDLQPASGPGPADAGADSATRCLYCGHDLPGHREIRYCPHCGGDQTAHACGACGEAMEEGWRFCVACGAAAVP